MAELGGFSVWGADDEEVGETSYKPSEPVAAPKRASNLFDDLEEANADWSIQASPPAEEPSILSRKDRDSKQFGLDLASSSAPTLDADLFADAQETSSVDRIQNKLQTTSFDEAGDDDFGDAEFAAAGDTMDDDDFGDFGTYEETQAEGGIVAETAEISSIHAAWRPLSIKKGAADIRLLEADIREILAPPLPDGRMYPFHDGAASQLSQDQIRQVEGEAQVLVREESRNLWHSLTAQPNLQPVDWMRSSTRRQHLISLGIPINLDEVRVRDGPTKTLAPVSISIEKKPGDSDSKSSIPRGGTSDKREAKAPELDLARAKELTALSEDQLTLLALPALRDIARELDLLTRQASALLTHHLSQREAHNADAEMYNGLIRDLVTGAANRIGSTTGVKRSNTLRKANTATGGRNSPSPAPQPR